MNWDQYLSPEALQFLSSFSHIFMLLVGIVDTILGLMIIAGLTPIGAYIASIWLLLIAINLAMTGHYFDIALRDVGLCLSAFGLAKLTEAISKRSRIARVQLAPVTGTTTPAARRSPSCSRMSINSRHRRLADADSGS